MKPAVVLVLVTACASLVGIQDQPDARDASGLQGDAPMPTCSTGWGSAGCVTSLVAGVNKTCAVANNIVYCWGNLPGNGSGLVSRPTMISAAFPGSTVVVAASSSGASAGVTCFDAGENVSCWGDSTLGQLQVASDATMPVQLHTTWKSVAVGADHVCGLSDTGVVSCWGAQNDSQLGTGSNGVTNCSGQLCTVTPNVVDGLSGDVAAIAAGDSHTCALNADGAVTCWGSNSEGQIGDGSSSGPVAVPQTVVDESGQVIHVAKISAGLAHTCALDDSGAVGCWGAGGNGQLGNGEPVDAPSPTFNMLTSKPFSAIATGASSTCAIDTTGAVFCWGDDTYGVVSAGFLGSGAVVSPASIDIAKATLITVGERHACALLASGGITCWGDNSSSELGSAMYPDQLSCGGGDKCNPHPVDVPPP